MLFQYPQNHLIKPWFVKGIVRPLVLFHLGPSMESMPCFTIGLNAALAGHPDQNFVLLQNQV